MRGGVTGTRGSCEDSARDSVWGSSTRPYPNSYPVPPVTPVVRPDAHPAHSSGLYLQLLGGGAAPPGDRWPED